MNFRLSISKKKAGLIICSFFVFVIADFITGFKISRGIYSFIANRISGSLNAGVGQGNIIRIDAILNSFDYWKQNVGKAIFGMGKFWDKKYMEMHPIVKWGIPWTAAVDNHYIAIIHESGVIGLFLMIRMIIMAIKPKLSKSNNINNSSVFALVGCFLTFFFFEGFDFISVLSIYIMLVMIFDSSCQIENNTKSETFCETDN